MARSLKDELARLEDDRRARIEIRAAALVGEAMARRVLRPIDAAPGRAQGHQI